MAPQRPRPTSLPVLPLAAAVLLLLALAQLIAWAIKAPNGFKSITPPVENQDVSTPLSPVELKRVTLPVVATNLQFGDPHARAVLTILSDPACGSCRQQVRAMVEKLPNDVRLIYKFWPQNRGRLTAGMAVELARREGVAAQFWQMLEQAEGDVDDTQLLNMLERAGVSLAVQRKALSEPEAENPSKALEVDLQTAQALQLPPPPVMVLNGYQIDATPEQMLFYIEKAQHGEPLNREDLWLMKKEQ